MAAVVAAESAGRRRLMHREGDAAAGTLGDVAALGALEKGGEPPAVEEQNHLLAPSQGANHRGVQRLRPGHRAGALRHLRVPEIDHLHRGKRPCADALREPHHLELPAHPAHAFRRWGCTPQHQPRPFQPRPHRRNIAGVVARRLAVLVAGFVLLIQDDDPEPSHRGEDGRAGAHGHPALAPPQRPPGVGPLCLRQAAVQHRHLVPKGTSEPTHGLRGEPDLGHQDHGAFSARQRAPNGLQVNQGLPAAGHPEQERAHVGLRAR